MIMVAVVIPFTMFYYGADSETCVLHCACLYYGLAVFLFESSRRQIWRRADLITCLL